MAIFTPPRRRGIPFPEFCYQLSIGKTTGYQLINENEVKVFKVGKKTLIDADSIDEFINRNRVNTLPMGIGNLRGNPIPQVDEQPTKKPSPPSSLLRRRT